MTLVSSRNRDQPGHVVAVSFHKFIDRLNRSGVLTTKELQSLLSAVPNDERPGDAEALARWLVKQGHLTPFQTKAIYLGHTKGLIVGNYVILDLLGVGGMGQVYKARHQRMKRVVALKLLSTEVAKKPKLVKRFHQEVEAAARLMHPNIVTAFDADEADGKHFLVMEYVPGRDLASLVKEHGRLSVDRSIRCILDAARGLEYAHQCGIVHRDVKPANLLLSVVSGPSSVAGSDSQSSRRTTDHGQQTVKILDMGLARIDAEGANAQPSDGLTQPGIVMGTVDFMSPEQAVNTHNADHRSDIYSLGITLHYLLTGSVPFTGQTVIEQLLAHREQEIPSLKAERSEVPSALDGIFARMIAKKPKDRYQSMGEVVTALEGVLSGEEPDVELPLSGPSQDDDSALVTFLDSMSGDKTAQQRAAAAVITPESSAGPASGKLADDTIVADEHSTAVDVLARFKRRQDRPLPWGTILLHGTWSTALLGLAVWTFLGSRQPDLPEEQPVPLMENGSAAANGDDTGVTSGGDPTQPEEAMAAVVDREFAEWVLLKGGAVMVADVARSELVLPGQPLPTWPFSITAINLPGTTISSDDDLQRLSEVCNLPLLRRLVVTGCEAIGDEWFAALSPFTRLMHLDIRGSSVTDASLSQLPNLCPTLEALYVGDCEVTAVGIEALARLPMLRELGLGQTPITAAAIPHLKTMSSLRSLSLSSTGLTPRQIRSLRAALPDCRITARTNGDG